MNTTTSVSGIPGNAILQAVPNAQITVCSSAGGGIPCSPLVTIYSNVTLTTIAANPLTADINGNFSFFVPPNATGYLYSQTAPGIVGQLFTISPATTTLTTGTILCKNFEQVRCVDAANSAGWAGSDVGAWVNAAYADLPATGGRIFIAGNSSCYVAATPILLNTNAKPALLDGAGKATCLDYSAVTSGSYITFDWGQGSPQGYQGAMSNIRVLGACATTACTGVTSTCLDLGPTNGFAQQTIQNIIIGGFSSGKGCLNGIKYELNAFIDLCINCQVFSSNIGLNVLGFENFTFDGGTISQNAQAVSQLGSAVDTYFYGTSFDANTTSPVVTNAGVFNCIGCHFENPGGQTANYVSSSSGSVNISNTKLLDDVNSGTNTWFVNASAGTVTIIGTEVCSSGRLTTNAVNLTGGASTSAYLSINYCGNNQPGSVNLTNESTPGFTGYLNSFPNDAPGGPALPMTIANEIKQAETAGPYQCSIAGFDCLWADSGTHRWRQFNNNASIASLVGDSTVDVLTNKTVNVPLSAGTAYQPFNTTTTCTTGAAVGATCTTAAITLPAAEADTSYRVTCTGKGLTNVPVVITTTNSSATQFTITIAALTAAAASFTSYDCVAGHN